MIISIKMMMIITGIMARIMVMMTSQLLLHTHDTDDLYLLVALTPRPMTVMTTFIYWYKVKGHQLSTMSIVIETMTIATITMTIIA